MKAKDAHKEFDRYLREHGHAAAPVVPAQGVPLMLEFYRDVRADDVALDGDGDMLLFQWGTYDWGHGPRFELDLARQLARPAAEDEDIWQLHLSYRFLSSVVLACVGSGNRWCSCPAALADFASFVLVHPGFAAVRDRSDGSVEIVYECAG